MNTKSQMKAVGFERSLPISNASSLIDIQLPQPVAKGRDLLIKVDAVAVNPVDYKVRQLMPPAEGEQKILGWDAVGEVIAVGDQVSLFAPGDKVYYAGDLTRPGSNAEYQLVDERIAGAKPKSLSNAEAAALPLTAITAYELLFEHLAIKPQSPDSKEKSNEVILVIGAAGGVGSILVQLVKSITGATVIGTASREASQQWVKNLGADHVVDHTKPLKPQIDSLIENEGVTQVTHIASLNSTESYFETYIDLLVPFGKIAMIDDPESLDVMKMKPKSISLHIEFMYARSMFNAADMIEQHQLLNRVSDLIDRGFIKTTIGKNLGVINAQNLRTAHEELESGKAIGKIVLENFS
ncbi:MAG: zinc-binding alcohol dehydrogenase family protein [Kangiellaceae bacterium]|nr:zinc-binding alcohol dehydrogenase family protein [Kangiellaceae bacterium]MCW9015484.1 zinc-binding alcohol dehydrogenase family protein [Kangiellaceae bacterium]